MAKVGTDKKGYCQKMLKKYLQGSTFEGRLIKQGISVLYLAHIKVKHTESAVYQPKYLRKIQEDFSFQFYEAFKFWDKNINYIKQIYDE